MRRGKRWIGVLVDRVLLAWMSGALAADMPRRIAGLYGKVEGIRA